VTVFVGRHERQLDPKGRLAMPPPYRSRFETGCYLAFGEQGCIEAFTPEEFEQMANETLERVKRGEITRAEQRALASSAFIAQLDAQGRITVDRELRDFAGIEPGSPVVVAGSFDRVEIWNPQKFERERDRGGAAIRGGD
jgi:MraZ protein